MAPGSVVGALMAGILDQGVEASVAADGDSGFSSDRPEEAATDLEQRQSRQWQRRPAP